MAIFDMLTMYKWDVKVVLALAAFALTYGEFCLLAHIQDSYQFAKRLAILKQLLSTMENASSLKLWFDTLNDLVKITLEVTKCVIDVHDLPTEHATAYDYMPIACYWTIRSIVTCTTQITSLTTLGYEVFLSNIGAWELSTLTSKLENIINHLRQQADSRSKHISRPLFNISAASASMMHDEAYARLRDMFSKPQTDNVKVLKALINAQDVDQPLYDGFFKQRVSLGALRRRTVLLLISGPEFSSVEIDFLESFDKDINKNLARRLQSMHGLVWIPIVDPDSEWNEAKQKRFQSVRGRMPWYSVYDPSFIGKPVISFIQKEWKYRDKPIMVVLDPQGKVSCLNAIRMIWIWGRVAYPFTSSREEALWKDQSWKLDFLADIFYTKIRNWTTDGKYIFLYGGNDFEWIKSFVEEARRVATATKINLEMLYVGKSNKENQVREIIVRMIRENLNTDYLPNRVIIWLFWFRLHNMLFSKLQLKNIDANKHQMQEIEKLLGNDDDNVMEEIKKLVSYDKHGGWILLAEGSEIVIIGNAATGLQTLVEYDVMWKEHVGRDGFAKAFKNHYNKVLSAVSSCCKFEFSPKIEKTSELLVCPECHDHMHVITTYHCCHDGETYQDFFFSTSTPPIVPYKIRGMS
ncbi:unnamed protein product [Sphenostylis stenocarpa]|uniref:Protein SIEVE ELEMENT OCCLUSION B-like n=1 Tax=Sphenostylis stenocarpa TaxID=92480 RepID=A0AA86RUQ1_9FABA|nr:unnamed protein product [Sphenostylis stenocarpa]